MIAESAGDGLDAPNTTAPSTRTPPTSCHDDRDWSRTTQPMIVATTGLSRASMVTRVGARAFTPRNQRKCASAVPIRVK